MKIVLSGIETKNKGAELMLYAILQEIENRYPNAKVYVPLHAIKQELSYINTNVMLLDKPFANIKRFAKSIHLLGILRRLHIPFYFFEDSYPVNGADYFIDASGFAFTDQWNPSNNMVNFWEKQLKGYSKQKTKIVFLPQAFGPVELPNTKRELSLLNQYADIIMPREKVSYSYLQGCNISKSKVKLFPDFTSLVVGEIPQKYKHLKGGICIIPNMRMIDKGGITFENYLNILVGIVNVGKAKGHIVYLLNHEGKNDEDLAYHCRTRLNNSIEVVTGLNALEVKGLISTSYLCVSSRFHGVASALNSGVPCLATSWSHKYAELYNDYSISDCILDLSNMDRCFNMVNNYMNDSENRRIREHLEVQIPKIQAKIRNMWDYVWGN